MLNQQWQQRLWKHHLKSEFALLQTLSCLFQLVQYVKFWQIFPELNSKRLYQSSRRVNKSRCLIVFTSSTKREVRHFHILVMQRWQRNAQKSMIHMQSSCFANLNLSLFCHRCCCCRRLCLSSIIFYFWYLINKWLFPDDLVVPSIVSSKEKVICHKPG